MKSQKEIIGPRGGCFRERIIARRGNRELRYTPARAERIVGPWGVGWQRVRAGCFLYDVRTAREVPLFTGAAWAARIREHADRIAQFLGVSPQEVMAIDPRKTTVFDGGAAP